MKNKDLVRSARDALQGKWLFCALLFLIEAILFFCSKNIENAIIFTIVVVLYIIVKFGVFYCLINIARGIKVKFTDIFYGLSKFQRFVKAVFSNILIFIFVLLWSLFNVALLGLIYLLYFTIVSKGSFDLQYIYTNVSLSLILFFIPIIFVFLLPAIKEYISYSMTFFIIIDDDKVRALDAISKSRKMMYGHKLRYTCMLFRFCGWFILSILTFGLGFLWLVPYIRMTRVKFYESLKEIN